LIVAEFGEDAAGPFDIDSIQGKVGEEFAKYEALVVSFLWLFGSARDYFVCCTLFVHI
jgi:hypothetical protein